MVVSLIALHNRDDGFCHQRDELLLPFRLHDRPRKGVLAVVEIEYDLLHGFAPVGSSPLP